MVEEFGAKVTEVPPRSYIIEGPAGRFLWEGAAINDEVFSHAALGTLNVTKAHELIRKTAVPDEFPINEQLLNSARLTDLDPDTLKTMTKDRIDEPVIFVVDQKGFCYLIDGAHRLEARRRKKLPTVRGFRLRSEAIDHLQARVWKLAPDGSRTPFDINGYVLEGTDG